MFSSTKTVTSTSDWYERIVKTCQLIAEADHIIIGAGAGLSAAAGLEY